MAKGHTYKEFDEDKFCIFLYILFDTFVCCIKYFLSNFVFSDAAERARKASSQASNTSDGIDHLDVDSRTEDISEGNSIYKTPPESGTVLRKDSDSQKSEAAATQDGDTC